MQKNIDSVVSKSGSNNKSPLGSNKSAPVLDLRQVQKSPDYTNSYYQAQHPQSQAPIRSDHKNSAIPNTPSDFQISPNPTSSTNHEETRNLTDDSNSANNSTFKSSPEVLPNSNNIQSINNMLSQIDTKSSLKNIKGKFKRFIGKFLSGAFSLIILPSLIVYLSSVYLIAPFTVSGSSMEPTLHNFDHILVSKLPIKLAQQFHINLGKNLGGIKRGDPIVFLFDENSAENQTYFVKRVIGLPGEKIKLKNGVLTIINDQNPNGLVLNEVYIDKTSFTSGEVDLQLGAEEFFVLGDNRKPNGSYDSRSWGALQFDKIVGVVKFRILPKEKIGTIKGG